MSGSLKHTRKMRIRQQAQARTEAQELEIKAAVDRLSPVKGVFLSPGAELAALERYVIAIDALMSDLGDQYGEAARSALKDLNWRKTKSIERISALRLELA